MKPCIMKCGHASVLKWRGGNDLTPYCPICNCTEIDHEITDPYEGLEGRMSVCGEHKDRFEDSITPSRWDLPFFNYRPEFTRDTYYCGCWGWN